MPSKPNRNPKPLLPRRRRRKADRMPELDPVAAPGEAIADPVVVPTPRKSRAGVFFLGALSGCLIVFIGMMLLGVMIAMMGNSNTTTRCDVFGAKPATLPTDRQRLGSRNLNDALHHYRK